MKPKIWFSIFFFVLVCSIAALALFEKHQREEYVKQCEKLATDWIHEQKLDQSDEVGFHIHSKRWTSKFYDLKNDGSEELYMTIGLSYEPNPGTQEYAPRSSSLLSFVFQKSNPILFDKIFTAGIWEGNAQKEKLLVFGEGLPNLLCLYDGTSESTGGDPTGDVPAHLFMMKGKVIKEVLVFNAYGFIRNAPGMYTSDISVGKNRAVIVDYSIPFRSTVNMRETESKNTKRYTYEWDARSENYHLKKGVPSPSYWNFVGLGLER